MVSVFRKEIYFCGEGLTRFCKTAGVLPVVSLGQQLDFCRASPQRLRESAGLGSFGR
jgi:hypothetical protein